MKYTIFTSGKINLGLTIVDKLPDGYHEIESIFLPVGIFDKITCEFNLDKNNKTIEISEMFYKTSEFPEIPTTKDNIVWKVVEFIEKSLNIEIGFKIHIEKNIPIGAGIGGGSGNGAGVFITLLDYLRKHNMINDKKLEYLNNEIHKIGSDIPFFLKGGGCIVQGKGEKITTISGLFEKFQNYNIILVFPNIFSSTREAYKFISENKLYDKERWAYAIANKIVKEEIKINDLKKMLKNTFELFIIEPIVRDIKEYLYLRGAMFSLMSGSGSCVYGIFERGINLLEIKSELINKFKFQDKQVFTTRFIKEPVKYFTSWRFV